VEQKSQKEFDYLACLYPEGFISQDFTVLFNAADIQQIVTIGFKDEEDERFQILLSEYEQKNANAVVEKQVPVIGT
jgi:hypothetical protein